MPHDGSPDPLARALKLAYRYLDRRERTTSEVRQYLGRKGCDAASTEQAVETLIEEGHLDDLRYARLFTADKRELEHWGSQRIRRTLIERGLDGDPVAEALAEGADGDRNPFELELRRALDLLRRRFPSPPRERRDRDRALGVLVRKGYELETALDALAVYARGE